MNKKAVAYLHSNKNRYSKDALVAALKKAGYSRFDITESVAEVFGSGEMKAGHQQSFWNVTEKKIYTRGAEKSLDFFFAVLVSVLAYFIVQSLIIGFFIQVAAGVVLFMRRRFMAYGFFASIILAPIIFVVIIILILISDFDLPYWVESAADNMISSIF